MTAFIKMSRNHLFPLLLLASIGFGGLFGYVVEGELPILQSIGALFLNLLLTAIVPLVFFGVSSAISRMSSVSNIRRIFFVMTLVFLVTSLIASLFALAAVHIFPIQLANTLPTIGASHANTQSHAMLNQLLEVASVAEFYRLLSHQHMFALIIFSLFVGFAALSVADHSFIQFLQAGERIFMRVFQLIMYAAPVGFFAYFATIVHDLGAKIMGTYLQITLLYYSLGLIFFVVVYSGYAYFSAGMYGVRNFWKHIFLPMVTAIATCSSAASIPANLEACKQMKLPNVIGETAIPIGSLLHKDGSVIGGIIKIAFLFSLFHLNFSGVSVLVTAVGVSMLVGTVMGAIPSGGMLGELLILSVYGFPPSALIAVAAISVIIDPLATMLNVTGNTISCMLINHFKTTT